MPLQLLLDECLRSQGLWSAIAKHNSGGETPFDVLRVGDPGAPGFETHDPAMLAWAAEHSRVIVSQDCNSLPGHLEQFIADGNHSPGIVFLQPGRTYLDIVDAMSVVCHCCFPDELADSCIWLPR